MKIKRAFVPIMTLLIAALFAGKLFSQSTQRFEIVKVGEGEKKYAASLLLEDAGLQEIIKILCELTGAQIEIVKPPAKNKKLIVEFHFDDRKEPRRLVFLGTNATVKTYVGKDAKMAEEGITILKKSGSSPAGQINIKAGDRISVEYVNIRLEELLDNFNQLGKMKFQLADELKKQNIRVNLKMENLAIEEALKALAGLENLVIKKLDENSFLIASKK